MVRIIRGDRRHHDACLNIARGLPGYFTEAAIKNLGFDLKSHRLYVATEKRKPAGFITVQANNRQAAELSWLAVAGEYQRRGYGSALVNFAARELTNQGMALLEVKTLAATVDYAPYESTRRFYEKLGFFLLEIIDPFP
jgi:ribosomal protein S18 acetylase RimI-like enzyme